MSGSLALYCAASAKQDDYLITNDNPDLWFLVILLLLVRNDLIQLVEDNTAASLGLLRRGGSSRRAAALPEKCKAKDSAKPPDSP